MLLSRQYGLTEANHVLVGHSCGATLAFQALQRSCTTNEFPAPRAIVGLAGIYDLRLLVDNHRDGPYADVYVSFVQGAFGEDREEWNRLSPTYFARKAMCSGRAILLVTAADDVLVEQQQREIMRRAILGLERTVESQVVDERRKDEHCSYAEMSVQGGHDEMWLDGEKMVAAVQRVLDMISGVS